MYFQNMNNSHRKVRWFCMVHLFWLTELSDIDINVDDKLLVVIQYNGSVFIDITCF